MCLHFVGAKRFYNQLYPKNFTEDPDIVMKSSGDTRGDSKLLWTLCAGLLIITGICVTAAIIAKQYRSKYLLGRTEVQNFFYGARNLLESENVEDSELPANIKYDKDKYEISESNFEIGKLVLEIC